MDQQDDIFREWDLYDRIGQANYMHQQEISAGLQTVLSQFTQPIRVIDLGCGDGQLSRRVFANSHVARFVGVDLSPSAIDRHGKLPFPGQSPGERELIQGDIATEIHKLPDQAFDVIHASYSLHHYTTPLKPPVLDDLARILVTGGLLIWTDVIRRETEDRETFIGRLADHIRADWPRITPDEQQSVIDHMFAADFPESESWMLREMGSRGFRPVGKPYQDPYYGTILFEKIAG